MIKTLKTNDETETGDLIYNTWSQDAETIIENGETLTIYEGNDGTGVVDVATGQIPAEGMITSENKAKNRGTTNIFNPFPSLSAYPQDGSRSPLSN